jgi:cyclic pyranopterin phosphate synthase
VTPLAPEAAPTAWHACRVLSCSVLPVRAACQCECSFCFSRSSISAAPHRAQDLRALDLEAHFAWARARGATRLVVTGGGEPLLAPDVTCELVARGARYFTEVACFTNGARLTAALAARLASAGLSYLCYSRHHDDDARCRALMGPAAPSLAEFFAAAGALPVRATCVMARGYVETADDAARYVAALRAWGVREFTFKHTYVAYPASLFRGSRADRWARAHAVDRDPFPDQGEAVRALPWGPTVRRIGDLQVCHYYEPTPAWELAHRLCRSSNLLSDGSVYASLEDRSSLLYRLPS